MPPVRTLVLLACAALVAGCGSDHRPPVRWRSHRSPTVASSSPTRARAGFAPSPWRPTDHDGQLLAARHARAATGFGRPEIVSDRERAYEAVATYGDGRPLVAWVASPRGSRPVVRVAQRG